MVVKGLIDASATALAMHDRFGRGHGVVVTDRRGRVLDLVAFTSETATAEDAIREGLAARARFPLARRMLLVSVLDDVDLQTPNELEIEMWHAAVDRCARVGLELWEWIVVSQELLRSLSMTAGTQAAWRSSI